MSDPTWNRSIPRAQGWGGCRLCQHFRPDFTCLAYPERIPLSIVSGEVDHLVPRPGQQGDIVFAPVEHPDDLQERLIRAAASRGVPWAVDALQGRPAATRR
jgi:hypothetical protein